MKIIAIILASFLGLLVGAIFSFGPTVIESTSRVDDLSAAIMSAPLVGCEPMDMEVRRVLNHRGQASWAVSCHGKKFICGRSKTAGGHTMFCHHTGCEPGHEPSEPPGKTKV